MKRQRGITEGWLIGIIVFIGAVALAYFAGRHDGAKINEAAWQKREAEINAAAAVKIDQANTRVRDLERAGGIQLAAIDAHYQTKLQEKDNALIAARRDARARGMFVNAACPAPGRNAASEAPAGAGVSDGAARVRLSDEDAEFFIAEAGRADRVVEQLTAAQAVIRQDRATCGGPAP